MKYIKKIEELNINKEDFPEYGNDLSSREKKILKDLVGDYLSKLNIIKDDGYYYVKSRHSSYDNRLFTLRDYFNVFEDFESLKFYVNILHKIEENDLESVKKVINDIDDDEIDHHFDNEYLIKWFLWRETGERS